MDGPQTFSFPFLERIRFSSTKFLSNSNLYTCLFHLLSAGVMSVIQSVIRWPVRAWFGYLLNCRQERTFSFLLFDGFNGDLDSVRKSHFCYHHTIFYSAAIAHVSNSPSHHVEIKLFDLLHRLLRLLRLPRIARGDDAGEFADDFVVGRGVGAELFDLAALGAEAQRVVHA